MFFIKGELMDYDKEQEQTPTSRCGEREREREHVLGLMCFLVPKVMPNLVQPVKGHWLKVILHHLPFCLKRVPNPIQNYIQYKHISSIKIGIITRINNIKQETYAKCFNNFSIPRIPSCIGNVLAKS